MVPGAKHMNNENHETNLPGGDRRLSDSRGFQFDHFCASDLRLNSQDHSGIDREWPCEFKRRSEEQKWPKSLHVAMFESSTSRQISSKLKKTMPPVGRKRGLLFSKYLAKCSNHSFLSPN
jgi:hypothetical protein